MAGAMRMRKPLEGATAKRARAIAAALASALSKQTRNASDHKSDGFVAVPREFFEFLLRELHGAELNITLAVYYKNSFPSVDGNGAAISFRELQRITGYSKTSIDAALIVLIEAGLIERKKRFSESGDADSSLYRPALNYKADAQGLSGTPDNVVRQSGQQVVLSTGQGLSGTPDSSLEVSLLENSSLEFALDDWAERLYAIHVKRSDRALVNVVCLKILDRCRALGVDPHNKFSEIEACLIAWNATDGWQEQNGRFAPKLAKWLDDLGYEKWPTSERQQPKHLSYAERLAMEATDVE
jgi:hypothetical protein